MARAHHPGPKPKYAGRIEKLIRISRKVADSIAKDAAIPSVNQGKPIGISDVVERVFRQYYGIPPEREQIMLITDLEHIIDQLPNQEFSYTYPTGVQVSLWHDNYTWNGEIIDTNNSNRHIMTPCKAQTFQEVSDTLTLHGLTDQSKKQLLDEAKKRLQASTHEPIQ